MRSMNQRTERTIIAISCVVAVAAIVYCVREAFFRAGPLGSPGTISTSHLPVVAGTVATSLNSLEWSLPGTTVTLLISDTTAEQELGLGQISSLASSTGMIFVFDKPDTYAFWMKDMEFPLDIIWLDQDYKIVHIEHDLSPSTYPQAFSPDSPAKYVIEVNAGFAGQHSLAVGQTMQISKK